MAPDHKVVRSRLSLVFALALPIGFTAPSIVSGQERQVHLSLQAGPSFSTATGNFSFNGGYFEYSEFDYRSTLAFRLTAIVLPKPSNGLQFGIGYGEKGMILSIDPELVGSGIEFGIAVSQVEFPLLVRFGLSNWRAVRPQFGVGAVLSLLSNCKYFSKTTASRYSDDCDDYSVKSKKTEIGATASAGVVFAMYRSWSLIVDAVYLHGFTSMLEQQKLKSRAFSVLTGIAYSF